MKLSTKDDIMLTEWANLCLLSQLSHTNFTETTMFQSLNFHDHLAVTILEKTHMNNQGLILMLLRSLLLTPEDHIFKEYAPAYAIISKHINGYDLATTSTPNRNAILFLREALSKNQMDIDDKCDVTFGTNENHIILHMSDVGTIMDELQKILRVYIENKTNAPEN